MLARYPHESNITLAPEFGLLPKQLVPIAQQYGVRKTREARGLPLRANTGTGLKGEVLAAIHAQGPTGHSLQSLAAHMPAIPPKQLRTAVCKLTTARQLFRAGPKGGSVWFGSAEWAEAAHTICLAQAAAKAAAGTPRRRAAKPTRSARADQLDDATNRRQHLAHRTEAAARIRREALARVPVITEAEIDRIAALTEKAMEEGLRGFCRTWGWQQFARTLVENLRPYGLRIISKEPTNDR